MSTRVVGKRIKALREERELSQENLADIFGFTTHRFGDRDPGAVFEPRSTEAQRRYTATTHVAGTVAYYSSDLCTTDEATAPRDLTGGFREQRCVA